MYVAIYRYTALIINYIHLLFMEASKCCEKYNESKQKELSKNHHTRYVCMYVMSTYPKILLSYVCMYVHTHSYCIIKYDST